MPSGSTVTVNTTSKRSPGSSTPPLSMLSVVLLSHAASAVGGAPAPTKFCTASPLTPMKALPNCALISSNKVNISRLTEPVFSTTRVNGTSQLSPLAIASPAAFTTAISGTTAVVGSSLSIPLPSSAPLSSVTVIVEPSKFTPSALTVAVFSR